MKTSYKLILTFILIGLLAACSPFKSINTDAEKILDTSAEIADFDLPAGFSPEFSASLMGYSVVSFNPGDNRSHLYLVQSGNEADREALERVLDEVVSSEGSIKDQSEVLETQQADLNGQEVTVVITDGVNGENKAYRQALTSFEGKGGPALLVFMTPLEKWDQAEFDALVASFR